MWRWCTNRRGNGPIVRISAFLSAQHFQYRRETLDEGEWHESMAVIRYWLHGRGCREWWQKGGGKAWYAPEFAALVDSEISKIEAAGAPAPAPNGG